MGGCSSAIQIECENKELVYEIENNHPEAYNKHEQRDIKDDNLFLDYSDVTPEQYAETNKWYKSIVPPTIQVAVDMEPPEVELELQFVNGFRCENSKQNVYWNNDCSSIIYMTASLGVVMNLKKNDQKFFGDGNIKDIKDGHNNEIEALHVNKKRTMCCTGQLGKDPSIYLWNVAQQQAKWSTNQGIGTISVKLLKFSANEDYIFTIDASNQHQIHAFDTESGTLVDSTSTGTDIIFDMATAKGKYEVVLAGKNGCKFVSFEETKLRIMNGAFGIWIQEDQTAIAAYDTENKYLSGSITGIFTLWKEHKATIQIQAHEGTIHCITISQEKIMSSGQDDVMLKVWPIQDTQLAKSTLKQYPLSSYARSIDSRNGKILAGLRMGEIWVFDDIAAECIMLGHGTGETMGLSVDSLGNAITTGDDNKILYFDCKKQEITFAEEICIDSNEAGKKIRLSQNVQDSFNFLPILPTNQQSRCIDINHVNGHVAYGTNDGQLIVRAEVKSLHDVVHQAQVSSSWSEVIQYSPDGKLLALGSHDNSIYLFDVDQKYIKIAELQGHQNYIVSIDWSKESQYIMSVDASNQCNYYDLQNEKPLRDGPTQLKDTMWHTYSNKIGWYTRGIHYPKMSKDYVLGIDSCQEKSITAVGDNYGLVNIYRFPSDFRSQFNSYRAHSSNVAKVKFTMDNKYLYTVGGKDKTLMKWKVIVND